ncbi:hypothetical protein M419DRAFT_92727 [Trichoderma reesei RUT C-30]|uniref:Tafazzin family protein n=1 Tax=Hypocrea jecorina (strain ATCC 56765 / BCRC 32924 / NRRL 11460 / Rut C-30) TaxID=1344414 RepID=A0A024RYJ9_HYPJR|nr:hypothetical protein M419DRAFT_92727 [Trichoderma reesei RUT C-30]
MGSVGAASRAFLYGLNKVEVTGLDNLLGVLDRRRSGKRDRGLLTNLRWGLGAHDICFKNRFFSAFFSYGQVLPTHRLWHSPNGGLYQPTITQAIKLLSSPSSVVKPSDMTFTTTGSDCFVSPSAFAANHYAWVHIFPEACCHQNPENTLRYFKWGVSRLILESDPAPEFVPMFIHGTQNIMPEDRGFPRFLPRIGQRIRIMIGQPTDADSLFGHYRSAWKRLVEKSGDPELLKNDPEAMQLRVDVAKAVRDEIQKLRLSMGFAPEEDETAALAETWSKEPNKRKFKSPVDGSLVNRH